jgi:cell division protein ZapA
LSIDNNQVKISIFGQEYSVKAPADPEYIKKIAEFLDGKMREVQSGFSTTQSSTRIAILAGMNITDELFNARQSGESIDNDTEQKISSLIDLIDDTL